MELSKPNNYLTVKKLREYLNKIESHYSEEDIHDLGEFENQQILYWDNKHGYSSAVVMFDPINGIFFLPEDY